VEASTRNKKAARKWIARLEPEGNTNIFDALVRAFDSTGAGSDSRLARDAADTVYLLTDGRANRGAVIDPLELLDEVERLNRHYRVTIHTIALGADADAGFMRSLADRFHGRFVHLKGKSSGE
jgi:Mg-chelatase subunit ChlD